LSRSRCDLAAPASKGRFWAAGFFLVLRGARLDPIVALRHE
jgi:hypothetical protein